VGPRAVLDAVVKRKIPSPCRESNPRTPGTRNTSFLRPYHTVSSNIDKYFDAGNSNLSSRGILENTAKTHKIMLQGKKFYFCESLLPQHGASSGYGWRRRPPGMQGNCECIE
jgi:hypothetical protein